MGQSQIRILYVDDDINNLNSFKATFRTDYKVFIASSAKEGLEVVRNNEIHIIFADQRMPEMTGVDFFETILKEFPEPIRILITGYTDIESVVAAINKGQVYRYISKPWNEQELRVAIENAFEIYDVRQRLHASNKELVKRNDELNRFVYSASHELKAPLRTIAGILKMAAEDKNSNPHTYFSMIGRCVNNLEVFIKNIVDYYRNQRYEVYIKEIDFDKLVKDVIENHLFVENISDVNFTISIDQGEAFVNDEFRMKIIVSNILSNSIKYQKKDNPEKKTWINIQTNAQEVYMKFEDNGIGVPAEYLDTIFNMFFRATDHSPGSGVGLYIVKEAIEKMNGSIAVKSQENVGTSFEIRIPNKVHELSAATK